MNMTAVSDFNQVIQYGGFGAASRATGQSKASLSRRVRELEESLGVRLIERGIRPLRMTDEGAVLHARTDSQFGAIAEALQDVKAGLGRPGGRLRISAPLLFTNWTLGPLISAFIKAYPDVVPEVTTEDRFVDLFADEYDVVIRANPSPQDKLVGRCFLRNRLILVAPPTLPQPAAGADNIAASTFPAVMRTGTGDDDVWSVVDPLDGRTRLFYPEAVLRLSSPISIRDAVYAGAGAALIPMTIVADDIETGRLVSWGMSTQPIIEAWVLHASRRLVSPKISAFINFICDYFPDNMRKGVTPPEIRETKRSQ
ncbi:LysR family transcriptional regulator [Acerihabitans sp. TG2]|uniref:LysR family transcriptional regulator n=1 Tax=Acerihabitans sp. TG2 TaxID=3096008 RepID=UPI002B2307FB|nr:LysR family transcriptional regulator [Acerihabitans sp. TG2]MEA9391511.1 LysR family transcriptional regulator [Acerihabitans sp. TG2]